MSETVKQLEKEFYDLCQKLREARQSAEHVPVDDYTFVGPHETQTKLADLFDDRNELILIHNMGKSCPYCTLWADGLNGVYDHLSSRAAVVMVSPDDPETQRAFAGSRKWAFPMVQDAEGEFSAAMGFKDGDHYGPGVSAFAKKDGKVYRTGSSWFGPGDQFCATWHLFDLLPNGPNGWEPKYSYE